MTGKYAQVIDGIRRDLNVISLKYLAIEDIIAAIGFPADQLCLHCCLGRSRV
jgi:amidophosphoribosyltransferase